MRKWIMTVLVLVQAYLSPVVAMAQSDAITLGEAKEHVQERVNIVDVVSYDRLIPNKEYVLVGQLVVKETGKPHGGEIKKAFTPTKESGQVELTFEVDTSTLSDKRLEAHETLYLDGEVLKPTGDFTVRSILLVLAGISLVGISMVFLVVDTVRREYYKNS